MKANEAKKNIRRLTRVVGSFKTANSYLVYGDVEKVLEEMLPLLKKDSEIL